MKQTMESPLLGGGGLGNKKKSMRIILFVLALMALSILGLVIRGNRNLWGLKHDVGIKTNQQDTIESELGVVAADDGRCSEIGASILRRGGHAVDAAVATSLCLGVVYASSSGIGGGAFMVVRSSATSRTQAFDMRETAPLAASQDMYQNNPQAKSQGALSVGVPGELAGLHEAWLQHGRLRWKALFQPAINLAKNGFEVSPYLGNCIAHYAQRIMNDPGLRNVYAPNGNLLKTGETCYNVELAHSLEVVAEQGPQAFYNGTIGEKLVKDVREAGGILTMEDLHNYKVEITDAVTVNAMGYAIYGMPPPSSGTLALSLVLHILDSYGSSDAAKGEMGAHRLIEALKHTFAVRMNLGDPDFVNITSTVSDMLSPSFAKKIQQKILDNTTFPPEYYMNRWDQVRDHGTSHFCIVDADRNAVSLTTTVNWVFGAGVLSPSTGIVLNNEMDDFSVPTYVSPEKLPPAPTNFIRPNKKPLSSMTPIIITKDDQLAGVIGGSGGLYIFSSVIQVFLNHFVLGMDPLDSVQSPRIYHTLIPDVVKYENLTAPYGDRIEVLDEIRHFLEDRGHQLKEAQSPLAITQLIVQDLKNPVNMNRKISKDTNPYTMHGTLTAVSDPRKGGCPAAI
ncbi:glutathione hydrolase 3-like [Neltuma alba]|uniref:glutathione hydrolase 3-like n=1 Tax=Neltuma alba TaxID=207710 RepID=UPI0010A40994|nr:glutathione hydrolase 3-like [Prosopis alba]XP_028808343.1 glutathione hydrolase 3-like [Prosopis alba]